MADGPDAIEQPPPQPLGPAPDGQPSADPGFGSLPQAEPSAKPPVLDYVRLKAPAARPAVPLLGVCLSLTALQVLWAVLSACMAMGVGCDTNGAPLPMFGVSVFAILPALGVVTATAISFRSRRFRWRDPPLLLVVNCVLNCVWIALVLGWYVHFLMTRGPNDINCP